MRNLKGRSEDKHQHLPPYECTLSSTIIMPREYPHTSAFLYLFRRAWLTHVCCHRKLYICYTSSTLQQLEKNVLLGVSHLPWGHIFWILSIHWNIASPWNHNSTSDGHLQLKKLHIPEGSCPTWPLVGLLVNLQSSPSDLSKLVKKLGHMLKLKAWIYSGHCVVKDDSDRSNPSFTHWRVLFYLPMEKSGLKVNHHICFALKS